MASYILAIDQGTTGSTVALMDAKGRMRASVNYEFPQIYPRPGWVEHRPADIWTSVQKGLRAILRKKICKPSEIAAIGITNQRETALLWDRRDGEPLNNAIVWQCRRTTDFCSKLQAGGHEKKVKRVTGLVLDPYFSASKFRWLLKNTAGVTKLLKSGRVAAGTIDSYVIWKLSGGATHATDVSNASRTSLMSLKTLDWDRSMMELFQVPRSILPEILPSSGVMGHTAGVPGLPDGIPIAGVAGDQQSALFGQACFDPGDAKCTFGTGSFILMNTGSEPLQSRSGLLTTVGWKLGKSGTPSYALEGGAFICGAAVQWLRDGLQMIKRAPDIEALATQVEDHDGVEFVPALTGLGAPHWAPEARGTLSGVTRGTQQGHIARATLDAMALQNADILRAMEQDLGKRMKPLRVDGGAASNNLLMQIQANVLGRRLIRPELIETTVAGACYLAGLGIDLWSNPAQLRKIWKAEQEFKVEMTAAARRKRLASWQKALDRTLL
ncbi:MAG: glycerol kinase GlpK [Halieaceae bacterium]|jgi:glycerol kinase|nr:glycerol kinase GlpK [Halieaceae bacterium]